MRHDQTILHDPETGAIGNCMQAAIATLLGLPMDEVPHFAAMDDWDAELNAWCTDRRLMSLTLPPDLYLPEDVPCILQGDSVRGIAHVVVGRGLNVVHDPHPSRDGLKKIKEVWLFAPYLETLDR